MLPKKMRTPVGEQLAEVTQLAIDYVVNKPVSIMYGLDFINDTTMKDRPRCLRMLRNLDKMGSPTQSRLLLSGITDYIAYNMVEMQLTSGKDKRLSTQIMYTPGILMIELSKQWRYALIRANTDPDTTIETIRSMVNIMERYIPQFEEHDLHCDLSTVLEMGKILLCKKENRTTPSARSVSLHPACSDSSDANHIPSNFKKTKLLDLNVPHWAESQSHVTDQREDFNEDSKRGDPKMDVEFSIYRERCSSPKPGCSKAADNKYDPTRSKMRKPSTLAWPQAENYESEYGYSKDHNEDLILGDPIKDFPMEAEKVHKPTSRYDNRAACWSSYCKNSAEKLHKGLGSSGSRQCNGLIENYLYRNDNRKKDFNHVRNVESKQITAFKRSASPESLFSKAEEEKFVPIKFKKSKPSDLDRPQAYLSGRSEDFYYNCKQCSPEKSLTIKRDRPIRPMSRQDHQNAPGFSDLNHSTGNCHNEWDTDSVDSDSSSSTLPELERSSPISNTGRKSKASPETASTTRMLFITDPDGLFQRNKNNNCARKPEILSNENRPKSQITTTACPSRCVLEDIKNKGSFTGPLKLPVNVHPSTSSDDALPHLTSMAPDRKPNAFSVLMTSRARLSLKKKKMLD